jgi:four helix bundle protein
MRRLDDLRVYKRVCELSDFVWKIVSKREWFAKRTLGTQFIEAADSVGANITEGCGRHFKKDKVNFFRTAKGSTFEAAYWCKRAHARDLLTKEENDYILNELRKIVPEVNGLIKSTLEKLEF